MVRFLLHQTLCIFFFRYLDKSGGNGTQFVGDTKCTKLPVELCGKGCRTVPGPEDCQERAVKPFY